MGSGASPSCYWAKGGVYLEDLDSLSDFQLYIYIFCQMSQS